jgi:hypothetical protein
MSNGLLLLAGEAGVLLVTVGLFGTVPSMTRACPLASQPAVFGAARVRTAF